LDNTPNIPGSVWYSCTYYCWSDFTNCCSKPLNCWSYLWNCCSRPWNSWSLL